MLTVCEIFLTCYLKIIWFIKTLAANVEFTMLFSSQVLFLPSGQRLSNSWQWCILYFKMVCVCVLLFSLFFFVLFCYYFGQRQIKCECVNGCWCQMGSGCETVDEAVKTSWKHQQSCRQKSKLMTASFPSKLPSRFLPCALSYPC